MGFHQPYVAPSLRENTSRNMPAAMSTAPGTSMRGRRCGRGAGLMNSQAPMSARGAITTLMPNDQRHE
jgi:hypothetical protein